MQLFHPFIVHIYYVNSYRLERLKSLLRGFENSVDPLSEFRNNITNGIRKLKKGVNIFDKRILDS